jgi:hypothetical protein
MLNYQDLMVSLLTASYANSYDGGSNYYIGRKYIMDARKMLRMDEAVLFEANKRGWEIEQLDAWICSKESYEAASNYIQDGANGFSSFFNSIKVGA